MLTLNLAQLVERLRTADRLLLIGILIATLAIAYSLGQGRDWWANYNQSVELRLEAQQLQTAIGSNNDRDSSGATVLQQFQASLAEETRNLAPQHNDEIIGLLGEMSTESRVLLASTIVSETGARTAGPVTYRVVNVSIRVEGTLTRIYGYLDLVSERAPTASITSARIGGFGLAPWALLDIEFLIRPSPALGNA